VNYVAEVLQSTNLIKSGQESKTRNFYSEKMINIAKTEVWIPFDTYWVSSLGRIRNKKGKIMTTNSRYVNLSGKMYRVKNLIAMLFLEAKKGQKVYWIDPDKGDGVDNIYLKDSDVV